MISQNVQSKLKRITSKHHLLILGVVSFTAFKHPVIKVSLSHEPTFIRKRKWSQPLPHSSVSARIHGVNTITWHSFTFTLTILTTRLQTETQKKQQAAYIQPVGAPLLTHPAAHRRGGGCVWPGQVQLRQSSSSPWRQRWHHHAADSALHWGC